MDSVRACRLDESAPLDLENLLSRCMGRIDLAERILQTFQATLERDVRRLEEAVQATNVDEIAHVAHRIKGASLAVSAYDLIKCASSIESSANSGQLGNLSNDLERLKREQNRVVELRRNSQSGSVSDSVTHDPVENQD